MVGRPSNDCWDHSFAGMRKVHAKGKEGTVGDNVDLPNMSRNGARVMEVFGSENMNAWLFAALKTST